MNTENKKNNSTRQYIRITDAELWGQIYKIQQLPKYKSFNKIINEALVYGLPMLHEKLLGNKEENVTVEHQQIMDDQRPNLEFYGILIQLLREIVLNEVICKSIMCSLFNAKELEYNGHAVPSRPFVQGLYSDTPEYLEKFEMRELKKIREEVKENNAIAKKYKNW